MTEDSLLVERCRRGDEEAFQQLVEAHHDRVYRAAYAVMANPSEAAEVTQATWVKAWRGLKGFRGEASIGTWLTRLALNTATDHLRRQQRRVMLLELLPFSHRPPTTASVEDRDELKHALDRLPPESRRLVGLRYGLGFPVSEIAGLLGCPEGTVKSRLHAATKHMRRLLLDHGAVGLAPLQARRGTNH